MMMSDAFWKVLVFGGKNPSAVICWGKKWMKGTNSLCIFLPFSHWIYVSLVTTHSHISWKCLVMCLFLLPFICLRFCNVWQKSGWQTHHYINGTTFMSNFLHINKQKAPASVSLCGSLCCLGNLAGCRRFYMPFRSLNFAQNCIKGVAVYFKTYSYFPALFLTKIRFDWRKVNHWNIFIASNNPIAFSSVSTITSPSWLGILRKLGEDHFFS